MWKLLKIIIKLIAYCVLLSNFCVMFLMNFINKWWMTYRRYSRRLRASANTIKPVFASKQNWILPRGSDQSSGDSTHWRNLLISSNIFVSVYFQSKDSQVRVVDRWLSRISCDEKSATGDRRCLLIRKSD